MEKKSLTIFRFSDGAVEFFSIIENGFSITVVTASSFSSITLSGFVDSSKVWSSCATIL